MVGHGKAWTLLVASLTDTKPDIEQWRAQGPLLDDLVAARGAEFEVVPAAKPGIDLGV
jgi:hypothetical protein